MRVPISWLQDYVKIALPVPGLAQKLTMAGTEVEDMEVVGGAWDGIYVGQITALDRHPNADRLLLATVDLGRETITVVTGAPNLEAGQKVPFAHLGAELIDPHTGKVERLRAAKIRGVRSEGMVCSEKELGISDRHEGIMILSPDAPVGAPLADYLGDTILDLTTTPNRPDCLSVIGIAREVAALTGQAARVPEISYEESAEPVAGQISIEIDDAGLSPRYCASLVTGVKIGPSPEWMQRRLLAGGMRPINNVVDITNYVMLEYGQPLHAFDYTQIKGKRIVVRSAREGEVLYTLDGVKRELNPDMLIIADERDPIALAGVMGGADSEVIETTTSILLESANFNGASIRRTSIGLNLRSEASSRFEKGISPDLAPLGLRRATQLFIELAGGRAARGIVDVYPGRMERKPILLTPERVRRVLGLDLDSGRTVEVLSSLGFSSEPEGSSGGLMVTPPYWRTDIKLADDLVEELARIIGYDEIPTTMLRGEIPVRVPAPVRELKETVRDLLAGCGMQEVITYSLVSQAMLDRVDPLGKLGGALRAANPMSSEQECLRTSLRAGLLAAFAANLRYERSGIRLFEVGRVYLPRHNDLPEEHEMLAGVIGGPRSDGSWLAAEGALDFFDAKGILETALARLNLKARFEPGEDQIMLAGRTAEVIVSGQSAGVVGELHPTTAALFDVSVRPVVLFEIDLEKLVPLTSSVPRYRPIPRYPAIARDIALVVNADLPASRVEEVIQSFPLVTRVAVFDVYSGDQVPRGKKSLALSVVYQSPERTLTDEQVDRTQKEILERLHRDFGATLRA